MSNFVQENTFGGWFRYKLSSVIFGDRIFFLIVPKWSDSFHFVTTIFHPGLSIQSESMNYLSFEICPWMRQLNFAIFVFTLLISFIVI